MIEKNIPMPRFVATKLGETLYEFNKMEVGDSEFFPLKIANSARASASYHQKQLKDTVKFKSQKRTENFEGKIQDGIRIWRII